MSPTDIAGVKPNARVEAGRSDKASESSESALTATSSSPISDSVELTETAQLLASFQVDLSSIEVVDMAKVESIRQSIAEGSYQIDPQKIAESLLSLEGGLV